MSGAPISKRTGPLNCAVLTGSYGSPYEFGSCKIRQPDEGEALVRLDFSGVCHGDVYSRDGGGPAPVKPTRPLTGGHEGIGAIVSIGGSRLKDSKFLVGDRVGVGWRSFVCGVCEACQSGADNFCPKQKVTGLHVDGTFQRYLTISTTRLARIPHKLNGASACPVLCAGVTTYTALRKLNPQKGKWCVISGAAGGLGHLAVQYAKKVFKLKVLAIDGGSDDKQKFCKDMGCDEYVDFMIAGQSLGKEVKEKTNGGAHYMLMLSPSQSAYDATAEYARYGAQMVAVGIGPCSVFLRPILQKDLTVRSSQTGTIADIEAALKLSADGTIVNHIEVFSLDKLNCALDRLKAGEVLGKLVIDLRSSDANGSEEPVPKRRRVNGTR